VTWVMPASLEMIYKEFLYLPNHVTLDFMCSRKWKIQFTLCCKELSQPVLLLDHGSSRYDQKLILSFVKILF
jgi:hypothetical protein